jgi:hypothetical protein
MRLFIVLFLLSPFLSISQDQPFIGNEKKESKNPLEEYDLNAKPMHLANLKKCEFGLYISNSNYLPDTLFSMYFPLNHYNKLRLDPLNNLKELSGKDVYKYRYGFSFSYLINDFSKVRSSFDFSKSSIQIYNKDKDFSIDFDQSIYQLGLSYMLFKKIGLIELNTSIEVPFSIIGSSSFSYKSAGNQLFSLTMSQSFISGINHSMGLGLYLLPNLRLISSVSYGYLSFRSNASREVFTGPSSALEKDVEKSKYRFDFLSRPVLSGGIVFLF